MVTCGKPGASLDLNLGLFKIRLFVMFVPSHLSLTLGLCLVSSSVFAGAVPLEGLVAESPFMLKQGENATPVVTEGATVEFRGMIATKEGVFFGLHDRTKNTSAWVRQEDGGADFKVSNYDAAGDLITVDYQGQRFTLPLSSSKIATAAPSPLPVVNAGQPVVSGSAGPGPRVDDQRRLESVAAEVRRRRALRQAANSGTPPPAAAQPATNTGQ